MGNSDQKISSETQTPSENTDPKDLQFSAEQMARIENERLNAANGVYLTDAQVGKINRGLAQGKAGFVISNEEMERRMKIKRDAL